MKTRPVLFLSAFVVLAGLAAATSAAEPDAVQRRPEQGAAGLTILLTGDTKTWLNLPEPPYTVAVTIKQKLEQAGFRVTMDPQQPYDAVMIIAYEETQGRQYRALEHGTQITCDVKLFHLAKSQDSPVWTTHVEAGTSWPTPIGSLYWDAVQNLEENPYFYYLGPLLTGWLANRDEAGVVFGRMITQRSARSTTEGGGFQQTGTVVAQDGARLNAVREIGRLKERRALPGLWELVEHGEPDQQAAAIRAIGEVGDPSAVDRLSRLHDKESDPDRRTVLMNALTQILQHR
jgi:hypothetical protein